MKNYLLSILVAASAVALAHSACPEIVTRAGWGARKTRSSGQMRMPVSHVFIHHTAGAKCSDKDSCARNARSTQNYHIDKNKWADIGYSFLVGGDGRIYEGRGWTAVGAHTVNYNSKAIGISFMGNFEKEAPSNAMLDAAKKLIACGEEKGYITKSREIHGHRDAKCTACPGAALYKVIQGWSGFKGGKLSGYKC